MENAVDEVKAMLFELMKKEKPELYKEVNEFLISKKARGEI